MILIIDIPFSLLQNSCWCLSWLIVPECSLPTYFQIEKAKMAMTVYFWLSLEFQSDLKQIETHFTLHFESYDLLVRSSHSDFPAYRIPYSDLFAVDVPLLSPSSLACRMQVGSQRRLVTHRRGSKTPLTCSDFISFYPAHFHRYLCYCCRFWR